MKVGEEEVEAVEEGEEIGVKMKKSRLDNGCGLRWT